MFFDPKAKDAEGVSWGVISGGGGAWGLRAKGGVVGRGCYARENIVTSLDVLSGFEEERDSGATQEGCCYRERP